MTSRTTAALRCTFTLIALAIVGASEARGVDPAVVVRAFCTADGAGHRLSPHMWQREIAPLVAWSLEPAWDRLTVIGGYEITSRRGADGRYEAEIKYAVIADITPGIVVRKRREEVVTVEVVPSGDGGWRLSGVPPVPHVFDHVADADALAELLEPGSGYESSTAFAWVLLREAGWNIPYTPSAEIPKSDHFEEVGTGAPGDLVVYSAQGTPYQVGLMQSQEIVLSTSLNGGRQAAPFAAFSGTISYWRPRRPGSAGADAAGIEGPVAGGATGEGPVAGGATGEGPVAGGASGDGANGTAPQPTRSPAPLRRR